MSLIARGLRGVRLITSDDHSGMKAARRAVFGGVAWQRCQFHLQQNAQAYVPKEEMKKGVATRIRSLFTAPDLVSTQEQLRLAINEYEKSAPKLSCWLEGAIPEGLTVFTLQSNSEDIPFYTGILCQSSRKSCLGCCTDTFGLGSGTSDKIATCGNTCLGNETPPPPSP